MKPKEQLMYLLEHYYKNNYSTDVFAEEFYRIYNFEVDNSNLTQKESRILSELSTIVGRFSSFEEDLKIPNAYFGRLDVKREATQAYLKLIDNQINEIKSNS